MKLSPVVEEIAKEYAGKVKVVSADIAEAGDVASGLGIMSIPQLFFYKDGKVVGRIEGAVPKDKIVEAMKESLGV